MSKPRRVYTRLGISDIVIDKEDADFITKWITVKNRNGYEVATPELYFINYELEDGTECNEKGEV